MTWDLDGLGNHEVKGRGEHMTWDLGGLGTRGAWPVAIFGWTISWIKNDLL